MSALRCVVSVPDSPLQTIAKSVRSRRIELGFSQEELAERAGLHRTYVGAIERGERNLTIGSLERIANALGWEVIDLLKRK